MSFETYKLGIQRRLGGSIGAGGQVLDSNFSTIADLIESRNGSIVQSLSANGSLNTDTDTLEVNGTFTVTLPLYASAVKASYIDSISTGGNLTTIRGNGELINGSSSFTVTDGELWRVWKGASAWRAKRLA